MGRTDTFTIRAAGDMSISGEGNEFTFTSEGGGSSVSPSTTTPKMDGTATVGTETAYARGDHVHPKDTSKQDTITGAASTIAASNLTASRALASNASGKVVVSDVTADELGYLDGVTSNVQTQINSITPSRTVNSSTGLAETAITPNTQTNGGSITLSKGRHIVTISARWAANATGVRQLWLSASSNGNALNYNVVSSIPAANGDATHQQVTCLLQQTETTTYYLVVNHSSSANVKCTTRFSVMRLATV